MKEFLILSAVFIMLGIMIGQIFTLRDQHQRIINIEERVCPKK